MRLRIGAVLVLGLFTAESAQAQTVQANNWFEAIEKTDCKSVHKEQGGTWGLLTGTMMVGGRSYGPSLPAEAAELRQKKCGCPHTLALMGVGC
jgi:hypothetical protein